MALQFDAVGIHCKIRRWQPGQPVQTGNLIAIDTETHLIDHDRPRDYPDVVVMTVYGGKDTVDLVDWPDIPEYLDRLFAATPDSIYVFHNVPFDVGVLGFEKWVPVIDAGRICDTGLQWVLRKLATRGLRDDEKEYPSLARVCLDITGTVLEKDGGVRLTFRRETPVDDVHAIYACKDAVVTWKVCMLMGPQATMATQVRGFMMLDSIRRNGMLVDQQRMANLRTKYLKQMDEEKVKLLAWGIRLDKEKTAGEMLACISEWIKWPQVDGKPEGRVWRLKHVLSFALENSRLPTPEEYHLEWTATIERSEKSALAAKESALDSVPKVFDLSKRQTVELLFRAANNIMEGKPSVEGLVEAWNDHEGWPGGYKEKGSETKLQELLEEAAKVHGISFERTETGKVGMSDEALESVPEEWLKKLPFLDTWKSYKHAEKLCSTFLNPEMVGKDGYIHPRPCPILATGRTSMRGPNPFYIKYLCTFGGSKTC